MTPEITKHTAKGWIPLFVTIAVFIGSIVGIVFGIISLEASNGDSGLALLLSSIFIFIASFFLMAGFYVLEPNEAIVLLLFGNYKGTAKESGFHFTNPFYTKKKISLRSRNFDSQKLKVNDKKGNPIEISAVIVWKVKDTAEALFSVENYIDYVQVQSESAVRHLATSYPYDSTETETVSLRASQEEVSQDLCREIQERVQAAGVLIEEARINHLAYAPEIAHAMLQRQQAEAVIEARTKIVDGAVGMVEMALERLQRENIVTLDEERKAAMVSNLLVVLCADKATQPIVNAGSLY